MLYHENFVSISSDGMKIKPAVKYESHRDCIGGFEDSCQTGTRSSKLANEIEAVWIRGIGDRWKQILGYYFIAGSVGKDRFKEILLQSADQAFG